MRANVQGEPVNVGGNVALYHKGSLYRLDVLSLGFPGTSGDLSALAATLIGPGGVSALYDGATGALTAWSNANRTYYTERRRRRRSPAPRRPPPAASMPATRGDPLAALADLASSLRDVQTATIQLVGHSTVNGHPATNLDVQMKRQLPGKPLENYHAQLALADDLGDFPVQIALQSVPRRRIRFGGVAEARPDHGPARDPGRHRLRDPAGLHAGRLARRRAAPRLTYGDTATRARAAAGARIGGPGGRGDPAAQRRAVVEVPADRAPVA